MKSNPDELEYRGYLTEDRLNGHESVKNNSLAELLKSENAVERTAAAKLLEGEK